LLFVFNVGFDPGIDFEGLLGGAPIVSALERWALPSGRLAQTAVDLAAWIGCA
jgi:hypothetical protein